MSLICNGYNLFTLNCLSHVIKLNSDCTFYLCLVRKLTEPARGGFNVKKISRGT